MKYKIVFFDVDGTLKNTDSVIPPSTLNSIRKLNDKGILTVIATGRAYYEAMDVMQETGIKNIITTNGGVVLLNGKTFVNKSIDNGIVNQIINACKNTNEAFSLLGSKCAHHSDQDNPVFKEYIRKLELEEARKNNYVLGEIGEVQLITIYCENDDSLKSFEPFREELEMVVWNDLLDSGYHIDFHPKGQSKADGVKVVLDKLGIHPKESIAFGDGMNDLEIIKHVGLGIAMGNANEKLKDTADCVTAHVDSDGIYKALCAFKIIDK